MLKSGHIMRNSNSLKLLLTKITCNTGCKFVDRLWGRLEKSTTCSTMFVLTRSGFTRPKSKKSFYFFAMKGHLKVQRRAKHFITEVMFMATVACPRHDFHRNYCFNGKIGIWSFIYKEEKQRNSNNRKKGTMVMKTTLSLTKEAVKHMLGN